MIHTYKNNPTIGWGNISLLLSRFVFDCPQPHLHKSILNDGRDKYIKFHIPLVEDEINLTLPSLVINQSMHNVYCQTMSTIFEPTALLQACIDEQLHLIDGVTCALHIRRGANQEDSKNIGSHSGNPAYFATEAALTKFKQVITKSSGPVFVASDSNKLKEQLKEEFGDKIRYFKTPIVLTYDCPYLSKTNDEVARRNCYLEWFLLSKCPQVYVTAGNSDMTDFSTYGYAAAVYGKKPVYMIGN